MLCNYSNHRGPHLILIITIIHLGFQNYYLLSTGKFYIIYNLILLLEHGCRCNTKYIHLIAILHLEYKRKILKKCVQLN